jgi:hypothetical protein
MNKELLKFMKRIWGLSRHQTYQKPSKMHHNCRISAPKRSFYSIVLVRLGVAENEKESDNAILQLWRRCVPLGLVPSIPLEEDIKAKCWDELIIPKY